MTGRDQQRHAFVRDLTGRDSRNWRALPGDASSRRYFRLPAAAPGPCLLMDVPPGSQDLARYVAIAAHLRGLGLSAPLVHGADPDRGLALIEDFGSDTYTNLLARGHDETALYELAIDTLVVLHGAETGTRIDLPPYDLETLIREAMLFADWFAPVLPGYDRSGGFRSQYQTAWRAALTDAAARREVLVLRDYHVDNLMLLADRGGVRACGLLDFQDALIGSAAYDVMSLTQDARRDVSRTLESHLLERYFTGRRAGRGEVDRADFLRCYHLLAAQRHAKVAGIFLRLSRRDGKHRYLAHVPRVLRLLRRALQGAGLDDLTRLLDRNLPGWAAWTPPQTPVSKVPTDV